MDMQNWLRDVLRSGSDGPYSPRFRRAVQLREDPREPGESPCGHRSQSLHPRTGVPLHQMKRAGGSGEPLVFCQPILAIRPALSAFPGRAKAAAADKVSGRGDDVLLEQPYL